MLVDMASEWPDLSTPGWLDTATTMHMWSQIVGKTELADAGSG